ncbi:5-carboxymethyl-2-hydroxymuconate Delta-isomerase [Actinosynnema pretiosum subsp. pretiosum]|uniref:5-carboxymethyl-2-hydroxymuconate Delta-isomerase n=1 Tax=Actinosynnema pretiosum subsp. pretiosum TaxID=103721 RepID=A0AA45R4H9_9PSEU|nr:isomerase [Actinosynnema pretiosum subsp. pretiosum]QUF04789.1 5-carboxymethyl-2-hydroxymuconate Delta-isomerase [Actinosynnema pretiosum subsp. pretiosum]
MPQITVEYSASLTDAFDRRAFALALHPVLAEVAGSDLGAFKTRAYRLDEAVVGDGSGEAMVHVRVALLSGRDAATKAAVSDAALTVLTGHLAGVAGQRVQATVEIAELDKDSYRKQVVGDL